MPTNLYKTIIVKKLYCGQASIRDYVVKAAIDNGKGLKIKFENHVMTLPCQMLVHPFQFHKRPFQSKFRNQKYQLVDFVFVPDSLMKNESDLLSEKADLLLKYGDNQDG